MKKISLLKRVILLECLGFLAVTLFIWIDEILDLPHILFGSVATPVNIAESIFETCFIFSLALLTLFFTNRLLKEIKYLRGFLLVCSVCKNIRKGDRWIPIEEFISSESEAKFSHGLCPDCAGKHYGQSILGADTTEP